MIGRCRRQPLALPIGLVAIRQKGVRDVVADTFAKQLESVITEYETARARSRFDDASDVISNVQQRDLQTRCIAAIERSAGRSSV